MCFYFNCFFQKWTEEKLIPNLKPNTIVVMDNAAYHNVQDDRRPVQSTRKADIQGWLQRRGIQCDATLLKKDLLNLVKQQPSEPTYCIDAILRSHGHDALRLPPYHAELNPVELIWAELKGHVARRNMCFR